MLELKGKPVADFYKAQIRQKIERLAEQNITVTMAIVLVGDDMASHMYAKFMKKTAENMGFGVKIVELPSSAQQGEVEHIMRELSDDSSVHGILPMMPLPSHLDSEKILACVSHKKDLDGLTIGSIGLTRSGKDGFWPCTPRACLAILDYYKIALEGKRVVVLGRSNVVGKPVAMMALDRNATVTICHSKTKELATITREADILISAIGKANFVTAAMVKEEAVVIDVGINEQEGKTVGDVVYEEVEPKVAAITPVPGGVGSVTTTMMLLALCEAYDA